jgi:hypothetical protein
LCRRDLLILVTRQHGVWIIVPAFKSHPSSPMCSLTFARSSTMSSAWTTAVATTLNHLGGEDGA